MKNQHITSLKKRVATDAIEACVASGCMVKKNACKEELTEYIHAPISMFPTPYPLHVFKQVYENSGPVGILVSNLISRPDNMYSILSSFLRYDTFLS